MRKTVRAIATLLAGTLVWARPALACPVCYGQADNAVIDGAKLSVIFLGALVYVLIGGGIALAVLAHRRAVKNLDPHKGLRLLPPERG
jgi:hypothetical protein